MDVGDISLGGGERLGREVDPSLPRIEQVNPLAPELFFLILAHPVHKM